VLLDPNDPLEDARYGIYRAQRHMDDLKREIDLFGQRKPHKRVIDVNTHGAKQVHKVVMTEPLPMEFAGIIFDLTSNLRAALDRACCAVAAHAQTFTRHAAFPFGKDAVDILKRHEKGSREIPFAVFTAIADELKPYPRGNDALMALQYINNTNKHIVVVPAAGLLASVIQSGYFGMVTDMAIPASWDPVKQEAILLTAPLDAHHEYDYEATVQIAIEATQSGTLYEAVGLFDACFREVERALGVIEAAAIAGGVFPKS
jgi:hypothetical protein